MVRCLAAQDWYCKHQPGRPILPIDSIEQSITQVRFRGLLFSTILTSDYRIWDTRYFNILQKLEDEDLNTIDTFLKDTKEGKLCLRGHWDHGKAINSAYWDARGRGIVSTCYDDKIRCKPDLTRSHRFLDADPCFSLGY